MWPRDDLARVPDRSEPQPASGASSARATARRANRPGYDRAMMWLAIAGVLVALASLVRDLIGG
jgi:hypothetical protein